MKRFLRNEKGNFATTFGVLAAVFSVAVAMAIQVAGLSHAKSNLQDIVDAAALAAAQEAQMSNFSKSVAQGVAENFVLSNITGRMRDPAIQTVVNTTSRSAASQFARIEITVDATVNVDHPLWSAGGNSVKMQASATARIRSAGKICVIALDEAEEGALTLTAQARMTADDCAVYSNSTNRFGIVASNLARLDSRFVCTAGGYVGKRAHFSTPPLTDCPKTPDPLAAREPPSVGACVAANSNASYSKGSVTLKPGTYCGGLTIKGQADVTLAPGEYVFKDGPLIVGGSATLRGDYVGLYFAGDNAVAEFGIATTIDLGAPKSGPMSGMLIFQDRGNSTGDRFVIRSSNARRLLGTVYIPRGSLLVDAAGKVADQSDYTAIVTREMKLMNGPNLVLNTNYSDTDVPVPEGVGPVRGMVWLSK
ncbi:MAG: TadE/TadG family type IV pilus assembly protein [Oricola sp.]